MPWCVEAFQQRSSQWTQRTLFRHNGICIYPILMQSDPSTTWLLKHSKTGCVPFLLMNSRNVSIRHFSIDKNAYGCIARHMRVRGPTHADAWANSCGCVGQLMRMRRPMHPNAFKNAPCIHYKALVKCGYSHSFMQRTEEKWKIPAKSIADSKNCHTFATHLRKQVPR